MSHSVGDHRSFHGETGGPVDYGALLPLFVDTILVAGDDLTEVTRTLQHRPHTTTFGYVHNVGARSAQDLGVDTLIAANGGPLPFPHAYLDGLIIASPPAPPAILLAGVAPLLPALQDHAVLYGRVPIGEADTVETALQAHGWHLHRAWEVDVSDGVTALLISARRTSYKPREHAAALFARGRADWAHDILYYLPERYVSDRETGALVALESMHYLCAIPPSPDAPLRLARFARARWLFSFAAPKLPEDGRLYELFAQFCDQTGLAELARRIRNTQQYILAADRTPQEPNSPLLAPHPVPAPEIHTTSPRQIRRVLMLLRPVLDYGLDVIYDGLCELLGDNNVVEFPHKPSLHQGPQASDYYPCTFAREGTSFDLENIQEQLRQGAFDLILFADSDHALPRDLVLTVLNANPHVPVAILDQSDSVEDSFGTLSTYLDRDDCLACFKRERLHGLPYHPRVVSLPFAYPASRIPVWQDTPRDLGLSWSGSRQNWVREIYAAHLERQLGGSLGETLGQHGYSETLLRTPIAPSFFGAGFDTVRYWEVPAHGALLLAERPPIDIPHNFVDGTHAIYFDDLPDLLAKSAYLMARPEICAPIARAGYDHLKKFHTGTARARQLIEHVERTLAVNQSASN